MAMRTIKWGSTKSKKKGQVIHLFQYSFQEQKTVNQRAGHQKMGNFYFGGDCNISMHVNGILHLDGILHQEVESLNTAENR